MSFDTKAAIKARLVADTGPIDPDTDAPDTSKALAALLAKDPAAPTLPAILNARMTDLLKASPVFDCVTFRENVGAQYASDVPTPIEYNQSREEIWHERFDFEIWSRKPDGGKSRDAIYKRIHKLLHGVSFSTDGGASVYSVETTAIKDGYDNLLNAHFAAVSYQLQVKYPAS